MFRAQFGEGRRIDDASTIGDLLGQLKVEPAGALAAAQSEPMKGDLRTQTEAAQRLGVFGAPSFSCPDGELFWGNDRLEQALIWAKRITRSE